MTAYWELAGLEDVYLEDSWVVDIVSHPGIIWFELDFVLREGHPLFQAPRPGEQYCYKRGRLLFPEVTELRWTDQGTPPAIGSRGETDYGSVDEFTADGATLRLTGDFGSVELVTAAAARIEWTTLA